MRDYVVGPGKESSTYDTRFKKMVIHLEWIPSRRIHVRLFEDENGIVVMQDLSCYFRREVYIFS